MDNAYSTHHTISPEALATALALAYIDNTPYQFCNHSNHPVSCSICDGDVGIAIDHNSTEWVLTRIAFNMPDLEPSPFTPSTLTNEDVERIEAAHRPDTRTFVYMLRSVDDGYQYQSLHSTELLACAALDDYLADFEVELDPEGVLEFTSHPGLLADSAHRAVGVCIHAWIERHGVQS